MVTPNVMHANAAEMKNSIIGIRETREALLTWCLAVLDVMQPRTLATNTTMIICLAVPDSQSLKNMDHTPDQGGILGVEEELASQLQKS